MTMGCIPARRWVLAAGALCLLQPAVAADLRAPSSGFRCTLLDGVKLISVQDIARNFPHAVQGCTGSDATVAWNLVDAKRPRVLQDDPDDDDLDDAADGDGLSQLDDDMPRQRTRERDQRSGAGRFEHWIMEACLRHDVDPDLVRAVIQVESGHRPQARSAKGALGLMQVMPATGARYGVTEPGQLLEPARNIDVGTRYLRDLYRLFDGRIELILAAYNAGEGAVAQYGNRIPPYRETREYVRRALRIYRRSQDPR